MKSKKEILKQFQEHHRISRGGLKAQYRHIDECQAFYAGDYMNYRDSIMVGRGSSARLQEVSFNRVKPTVNAIVGFMAQMRRKPDYQAREQDSQEQQMRSDYINALSDYVRANANANQHETRQNLDLIVGGVGVTDSMITLKDGSATRDPNGEIIEERVDPRQTGWDPACDSPNLLGSRWVYRVKQYDAKEAEELFGGAAEEYEGADQSDDTSNYQYNPFGGIQDKIGYEWADSQRHMVRVYFYQWYDIEAFYRIENPLLKKYDATLEMALRSIVPDDEDEMFRFDPDASLLVITKENRAQVREIFEMFEIPFDPMTSKRKVYYTAIISGERVFDVFKSVSQQGYSLQFKTGDRDEANHIWTGIVASMRDPQRYYNKSLTEMMLIIANNSRGGVMYEKGAIDNVRKFEAQYARYDAAVEVNVGALTEGKIQPKATPAMQSGYENILAISDSSLSQVTGIDESFFGAIAGGNETAMLQRQRIKQATVTLAPYIDAEDLYIKEQARLMLSYMRLLAAASDGAFFSMEGEDGQPMQEVLTPDFFSDEYDIVVGEAPETPVQKEFMFNHLSTAALAMLQIGDARWSRLYSQAIDQLPIANRDKAKIKETIAEQGVDPRAFQQMQQDLQKAQSQIAQIGMAKEIAGIQKTRAETAKVAAEIPRTEADTRDKNAAARMKTLENALISEGRAGMPTHSI
jgi:hypothetical protein